MILDAFTATNEKRNSELPSKRIKLSRNCSYSSFEVIKNLRNPLKEDDFWSIGLILLEMALNHIPFEADEYGLLSKEYIQNIFKKMEYSTKLIDIIANLLIMRTPIKKKDYKEIKLKQYKFRRFQSNMKRLSMQSKSLL